MSLTQQAMTAYGSSGSPIKSDRSLEYDVIAKMTSQLRALDIATSPFPEIARVVDANRRMWTLIATSMADPQNSFPAPLKANLFYLAEFTVHQSRLVLTKDAGIHVLVDVNLALMRGLKSGGLA